MLTKTKRFYTGYIKERTIEGGGRGGGLEEIEPLGLTIPALTPVEARQTLDRPQHVRVLRPQLLLPPFQRPSIQLLGLVVPALISVDARQVLGRPQRVRVLRPQLLLPPFQRPSIQLLGLVVPALVSVDARQVLGRPQR